MIDQLSLHSVVGSHGHLEKLRRQGGHLSSCISPQPLPRTTSPGSKSSTGHSSPPNQRHTLVCICLFCTLLEKVNVKHLNVDLEFLFIVCTWTNCFAADKLVFVSATSVIPVLSGKKKLNTVFFAPIVVWFKRRPIRVQVPFAAVSPHPCSILVYPGSPDPYTMAFSHQVVADLLVGD